MQTPMTPVAELEARKNKIDRAKLPEEVEQQPGLFSDASKYENLAWKKYQLAKDEFEDQENIAWMLVKQKSEEAQVKAGDNKLALAAAKLTEADKKACVALDEDVVAARKLYREAEFEYMEAKRLGKTYYQRGASISIIAKMVLGDFINMAGG